MPKWVADEKIKKKKEEQKAVVAKKPQPSYVKNNSKKTNKGPSAQKLQQINNRTRGTSASIPRRTVPQKQTDTGTGRRIYTRKEATEYNNNLKQNAARDSRISAKNTLKKVDDIARGMTDRASKWEKENVSARNQMLDTQRTVKNQKSAERVSERMQERQGKQTIDKSKMQETALGRTIGNASDRWVEREKGILLNSASTLADFGDMLNDEKSNKRGRIGEDFSGLLPDAKDTKRKMQQSYKDYAEKADTSAEKLSKLTDKAASNVIEKKFYEAEDVAQGMISDKALSLFTGGNWAIPLFARTYSQAKRNAEAAGATQTEARAAGLWNSAVEIATEGAGGYFGKGDKLLGKVGSKLENRIVNRFEGEAAKKVASFLARWERNNIEESLEEVIGNPLQNVGENIIYRNRLQQERQAEEDARLSELGSSIQKTFAENPTEVENYVAELNSPDTRASFVRDFMNDNNMNEEQAEAAADKMLSFMEAAAMNDTQRMKEISASLSQDLSGDTTKKIFDWNDTLNSILISHIVGIGSGVNAAGTMAQGQAILNDPNSKTAMQNALQKTAAFDKENSLKAKALLDTMEKDDYTPTPTQAYDIMANENGVMSESAERQRAAEKVKEKGIKRENLSVPVSTIRSDGKHIITGQQTTERYVNRVVDTFELIDAINSSIYNEAEKVSDEVTERMAEIVPSFDVGTLDISHTADLTTDHTEERYIFKEMTGVDLDQFNVYSKNGKLDTVASNIKMQEGLLALSAQNYIESARIEQEAWNDQARGEIADALGSRFNPMGDIAIHDALNSVDPRDQAQFMLMTRVAQDVYRYSYNTQDEWQDVKKKYQKMYPSLDVDALEGMYESAKQDRAEQDTPYLNYEVKEGEALDAISKGEAKPKIRGKFVNETSYNPETGEGINLPESDRIVYASLAKGINANITMIDAQDERLAYTDENGNTQYNNASVDLATGDILISNAVDAGTAVHEVTHVGARLASRYYRDLADYIFDKAYKYDPEKTMRILDAYRRTYADQNLSDAKLKEEVVSDLVAAFQDDPRFARDISQDNSSLVRKIINAIEDLLRSLRNILATGKIQDPAVQNSFLVEIGAYEEARRMWLEMYREAQKNNAALGLAKWHENAIRDNRIANARHTNVEQAEKERELFFRDSEGNGLTERQAQIVHDIGPDIRFSRPTFLNDLAKGKYYANMNNGKGGFAGLSEIASGKDILKRTMQKNGFSENQTDAVVGFLSHMADYLDSDELQMRYSFIGWQDLSDAEITVRRDKDDNIIGVAVSAMVVNGEYPVNFDMTTICNKREGVMEVIQELTRKYDADTGRTILNSVKLTDEKMWSINKALKAEGIDTACLGCFVEARRYYTNRFIDKIDDVWNSAVRDARRQLGLPEEEYFNFAKGKKVSGEDYNKISDLWTAYDESTESKRSPSQRIKILMDEIVRNKEVDSPYLKLISAEDILTPEGISGFKKISTKDRDMVKMIKSIYGTSAPKEILAFTPYNSEIALLPDKIKGMETGEYLKSIGGTRVQSFSDFKMAHMFDHMQMVADEAARGFVNHGYSKVIAYPRLFGLTGRKINMSVMFDVLPASTWQATLGCSEEAAKEIADRYQGLRFVKEKPAENPDNRPYIETEIEGVHGYLTYLVSDADYVNSVFDELYQQYLAEGMDEDTARREANKAKPFEQSINYREAVDLENQDGYKENVGIIAVAYGNEHLKMLLDDPNVRYIIPYHRSGLPVFIAQKTALDIAKDYTDSQNTRKAKGGLWSDAEGNKVRLKNKYAKWKEEHADEAFPAIAFFRDEIGDYTFEPGKLSSKDKVALAGTGTFDVYENLDKVSDIREISNAYLEHCINNNQVPIFHEFAGHDNYYKMLFDFAVTDAEGNIYPQRPVHNVYPGLDIDAKAAAGEEITEEDYAEFYKAIEEGLQTENAKNELRSNRLGKVLDEDLLSREGENSIIADSNIQHIVNGTPDYTDPKSSDVANSRNVASDEDGLVIRNGKARWTDERIDRLIRENGASNQDYSQAYATLMNPRDYLKLTLRDSMLDRWNEGANDPAHPETYSLNETELREQSQTPYLQIWSNEGTRIQGHEGRHRMRALMEAGVTSVPVVIRDLDTKYTKTSEPTMILKSQDFGDGPVNDNAHSLIFDLVPIKSSNRDELIQKFGGEADVQFSRPVNLDDDYMAAVNSGNMDEAQRLVDEAAGKAGYITEAWHQTGGVFTVFNNDNPQAAINDSETPNGLFFKTNDHDIGLEGKRQMHVYLNPGRVLHFKNREEANQWYRNHIDNYEALDEAKNADVGIIDDRMEALEDLMFGEDVTDEQYNALNSQWDEMLEELRTVENGFRGKLRELLNEYFLSDNRQYDGIYIGYDGHRYVDGKRENVETYIVFDSNQVKSADTVTYAEDGSVIPLSERFDPTNNDIRYSRPTIDAEGNILTDGQMEYFKNSKAVDEQGRLIPMYHVTPMGGFTIFDPTYSSDQKSISFTSDMDFALNYSSDDEDIDAYRAAYETRLGDGETAGVGHYKAYLDMQNPYIVDGSVIIFNDEVEELTTYAQGEGYDGLIIRNFQDLGADVYQVFSSNQVKDTRNENPTENPDIRYSRTVDDEAGAYTASQFALDNSYEALKYYEDTIGQIEGEDYEDAYLKAKKYAESDIDKFYNGLTAFADDYRSDDPVIEEGRNTMAKSKQEYFNSLNAKWNDRWRTEGTVLEAKSVKKPVRDLVSAVMQNSDTDHVYRTELVNRALIDTRLAYDLAKRGREDVAYALLWHSALKMIDGVEFYADDGAYEAYKEMRDFFKETKISLGKEYWSDVKFGEFRKRNMSRIKLVKGSTNVDSVYRELQARWPEWFDEEEVMTPPDQLLQIEHVLDSIQPYKEAYSSEEVAELATDIATDLFDIMTEGRPVVSLADKYEQKTDALKARQADRIRTLREQQKASYDRKTKALKVRHAEAMIKVRQQRDEAVRKTNEKWTVREEKRKERLAHNKAYEGIQKSYNELYKRLTTNTVDKHIPEQYKQELADLLLAFDLQSVRSKQLEAKRGYKAQNTIKLAEMRSVLKKIGNRAEMFTINDSITDIIDDLLGENDAYFSHSIEGETIDELSASELKKIDKLFKSLIHEFNNYEKVRVKSKKQQAADLGHAMVDSCLDHRAIFGEGKDYQGLMGALDRIPNLDEMTAAYLFRRIDPNGVGMRLMFDEINRSFDHYVKNTEQLQEWMNEILGEYQNHGRGPNKYGADQIAEWRNPHSKQRIYLERGMVEMTPAQMMSLYCLSKRAQAHDHMTGAGIVIAPVTFFTKTLKPKAMNANLPQKLTDYDIERIIEKLTPDQIKVADKLQELMATKMADWGNEASMNVIGIKLFEDPNYFPIWSDKRALTRELNEDQFVEAIRNFGFTKAVQPGARNAIMIDDIFTIVSEHCNNMNLYNSYSESMNDFMKVYNYRDFREDGSEYTVQQAIANAYSQKATTFIMQFMKDLNGNVSGSNTGITSTINGLLANAKKASVFANVRVLLQQPTAITRALAEIDPKYLKGINLGDAAKGMIPTVTTEAMKEMFEHCPRAWWKAQGYYDINMGKSVEDVMMNNGSFWDDLATSAYGKADNITWTAIWQMCKAEVEDKHKDVEKGSDEYWELCNERMTEVVDLTQVMDSPIHRSHGMRSKDIIMKSFTSFMAEPTLTFNMLKAGVTNGIEEIKAGNTAKGLKILGRTASVLVLQAATVSAAAALWDAVRGKNGDDDDEEKQTYLALWWINFIENLKGEARLWNKVYFLKDIDSVMSGYDFNNLAIQGFKMIRDGWNQLTGSKRVYSSKKWYENLFGGIGYLFGVPVKTILQDVKAVYHLFGADWKFANDFGEYLDSMAVKPSSKKDEETPASSFADIFNKDEADEEGSWFDPIARKMGYKPIGTSAKESVNTAAESKPEKKSENTDYEAELQEYREGLSDNYSDEQKDKLVKQYKKTLESETSAEYDSDMDVKEHIQQGLTNFEFEMEKKSLKAAENAAGLSGNAKNNALWDVISEGYTKSAESGNMGTIQAMKDAFVENGGDADWFDAKIVDKMKSEYKKTIVSDPSESPGAWARQAKMRNYMIQHGVSDEEISEIVRKTYTARDLKAAMRMGVEEYIIDELEPLIQAGLTREDYEYLYKYRNMGAKQYDGKYTDPKYMASTGTFIWPTEGVITSYFGYRNAPTRGASSNHPAIDIGAPMGTDVVASDGGTVIYAGSNGGYGNSVGIKHDNGMVTYYNHLSSWAVNVGDRVMQGQPIANVGSTGISTGPHLDFKVLDANGKPVDPLKYLASRS